MRISPTLAANEIIAAHRRAGRPVLPLGFGEAGLPVLPELREELARHAHRNGYGPVAGIEELRIASAGYWTRRGLPTEAERMIAGPGSKSLLYALLLATEGDVVLPQPSWVSYAAQADLAGRRPIFVPTRTGQGGVPDPDALADTIAEAHRTGRRVGSIVLTQPDNPTGGRAEPAVLQAVCEIAERHGLLVISDEIYRDLLFPGEPPLLSPAALLPDRVVVTSGLSKNLALGGWRLGVARLPAGDLGIELGLRLAGIASELWSSPAQPVQWAAAYAYAEPAAVVARIEQARTCYAAVTTAVAEVFRAAGCSVPQPRGGFYIYPDLGAHREVLRVTASVHTGAELADLLLREHGVAVLPGSAFGEDRAALRLRVATSLLLGETDQQRNAALAAPNPTTLPWIAAALTRLTTALTHALPALSS